MREYFTLHRSVFPSYLTIESGRICVTQSPLLENVYIYIYIYSVARKCWCELKME